MPTVVQFRRGTTSQNNSFTGALGELSVDTSLTTLRVHDGSTAGGSELLRKDLSNLVTTTSNVGTSPVAVDSFPAATYRSAKWLVSIKDVTNTQYQTCEITMIHDGTTPTISVYGLVYTGASSRMNFTASISSGTITLYGTGVSANNTVKLVRFAVPV
jgi:hypothetical protein